MFDVILVNPHRLTKFYNRSPANREGGAVVKITPTVTQLTNGIAAKLQRLYLYYRGPAFRRKE